MAGQYADEIAREYLRNAFMDGTLDVGRSAQALKGFVQIFAGEMEALIAVEQTAEHFLDEMSFAEWVHMAAPTPDSVRHLKKWKERI